MRLLPSGLSVTGSAHGRQCRRRNFDELIGRIEERTREKREAIENSLKIHSSNSGYIPNR